MRLALDACEVDLVGGVVHRDGARHGLTELERRLLAYLASRPGNPVPRDALLTEVWGFGAPVVSRCVDSAVRRLRVKVERDADRPVHLVKVHGVGYRFDPVGHGAPPRPVIDPAALPDGPPIRGREVELDRIGRWLQLGRRVIRVDGLPGSGRRALLVAAARRFGGHFPRVTAGLPASRDDSGLFWADTAPPDLASRVGPGARVLTTGRAGADEVGARLTLGPLLLDHAAEVLADRLGEPVDDRIRAVAAAVGGHPAALVEVAERWAAVADERDPRALCPRAIAAIRAVDRPDGLVDLAAFQGPFTPTEGRRLVGADRLVALTDGGWVVVLPDARLAVPRLVQLDATPPPAAWEAHRAVLSDRLAVHRAAMHGPARAGAIAALTASRPDVDAALDHGADDPGACLELLSRMNAWSSVTRTAAWMGQRLRDIDPTGLSAVERSLRHQLLGEAERKLLRFDAAEAEFLAGVREAGQGPARELGLATGGLAIAYHSARKLDLAEPAYREAARLLVDDPHFRALYLANLGQLLTELSRPDEAEPVLREVLALRVSGPDRAAEDRDRLPLAACLLDLGRHGEVAFHLDRLDPSLPEVALVRALFLLDQGAWRDVFPVVAGGRAADPNGRAAAILQGYQGVALGLAGAHLDAIETLRDCVEAHQRAGQPDLGCVALAWLAAFEAARGDGPSARLTASQARDRALRCAPWRFAVDLVDLLDSAIDAATGRPDEARARLEIGRPLASRAAELRVAVRLVEALVKRPPVRA